MNKNITYILTALLSGIAGWFFYSATHKKIVSGELNPNSTTVKMKDGKYFLVYNGAVDLSKEITEVEYEAFISQYPTGVAPFNILSMFNSRAPRYTKKGGKYYEYKWIGEAYGSPMEITGEEYAFLTNKQMSENFTI